MTHKLFYLFIISLLVMYVQVKGEEYSSHQWIIKIDPEKENLSISTETLGIVIRHIRSNLENPAVSIMKFQP